MKLLMVFPCPSERTVLREPRLGHGRHIGGGQGPEVGDAPFKVVQFPRQAFVPGARGFGRTAARVPVPRWPRLYIRCPARQGCPGRAAAATGRPRGSGRQAGWAVWRLRTRACGGLDLDVMRRGNRTDRAHLALLEPLLRRVGLLVELEPTGDEIFRPEPEDETMVADVLAALLSARLRGEPVPKRPLAAP